VGACLTAGSSLDTLVRQVEVIVCSTQAAERVRQLANGTTQVIIDDRALDKQAIDTLAAIVIGQRCGGPTATPVAARKATSGSPSRENLRRRVRCAHPPFARGADEAEKCKAGEFVERDECHAVRTGETMY